MGSLLRKMFDKLRDGFLSLRGSSKYLWVILLLTALESFCYFVLSLMYTTYLTDKFGLSDVQAGVSYAFWGMLITMFHIAMAPVVDFIGVRASLSVGFFLATVGRILVAFTHSKHVLWVGIYGLIPMGSGFTGTMLVVGIKRYANPAGRGFAYGLYYSIMNVAALVNGMLFDFFRIKLVHGLKMDALGRDSPLNDGYRLYLLVVVVASVAAFIAALFLDDSAAVDDPEFAERIEKPAAGTLGEAFVNYGRKIVQFVKDLKDLLSMNVLKYLVVCALTINLKQIFRHLDATYPKYLIRSFGCDAPVGLTYSINPFIIIFTVPVVQAVLTKFNDYDVIHYGSYVTGLSPFVLFLWQTKWAATIFIVMLSIGESIWSPRWYDYSMSIAPHSREAIFSALASAPLFFAKLPTGWLSGWVLKEWCQKNIACGKDPTVISDPQPCNGQMVWLVIGIVTFTSPLGLLLGSCWLRSTGEKKQPTSKERTIAEEKAGDEAAPLLEE